jgi:O-antigen ligase/tetratricopeptide (TPR) repeat protein
MIHQDQVTPTPRGAFLVWLFVLLVVVYLTVLGGGAFTGLYIIELRIASTLIAAVAIVIWLSVAWRVPFWRPRTVLWPALIAVPIALVVALIGAANPSLGYDYIAYTVLLAGCYLVLQRLSAHPYFNRRLASLAVILGFSLCALYIAAVVLRWIDMWSYLGRFVAPPLRPGFEGLLYGNPSAVAAAVVLLWLIAASHLGIGSARNRAIVVALGVLTALTVLLTGSRGAWAGAAVSAAIVIPVWLANPENRHRAAELLRSPRFRLLGRVGILVGLVPGIVLIPALAARIAEPATDLRGTLLAAAWRMFLEHPLTGVGPGNYVAQRAAHITPDETSYYVAHAHNVFVQTVAELGIVGVLASGLIVWNVGALVVRALRSDDPRSRRLGWAALAGFAYLAGHQFFDFYMNMPAVGLMMAVPIARIDSLMTDGQDRTSANAARTMAFVGHRPVMLVLILATVASVAWSGRTESLAMTARAATEAANDGNWPLALDRARVAAAGDSMLPPYQFTLGLAAANAGEAAAARDAFQLAAQMDDYPTSWLNLAKLELDLGHTDAARAALDNALRLGRAEVQVAAGAALLYVELEDEAAAASALEAVFSTTPSLAGDPFWQSSAALRSAWMRAVSEALRTPSGDVAYQLALEAGLTDRAREIALALPDPQRDYGVAFVEAWAGNLGGFEIVRARAHSEPLDGYRVALCYLLARHATGELGLDADAWQCDRVGYALVPIDVEVGDAPTSRLEMVGPNSFFHFQSAYERFVPFNELVPGLPNLRSR